MGAMSRSQEAYDRFENALEIPMLLLSLAFIPIAVVLIGIALLSVVTANIASFFVHTEEGKQLDELDERLSRIEALLEELRDGLSAGEESAA